MGGRIPRMSLRENHSTSRLGVVERRDTAEGRGNEKALEENRRVFRRG